MSLTLSVLQEVTADIQPVDARGNPAPVDGVPVWSVSDPAILSVRVSDNGLSAVITPTGGLGNAQVTVTADARLGEEVRAIVGTGDLTVVAAEASALRLAFGVPTDITAPEPAPVEYPL